MSRIAILADLHLPDRDDTVKEQVLDWALAECSRRSADLIVAAGDVTSIGTIPAAERFRMKLDRCGVPFIITPGNAEIRRPAQTGRVLRILDTREFSNGVLVLDSSKIALSEKSRTSLVRMLEGRTPFVAVTHCPLDYLPEEDQALLKRGLADCSISLLVTAHIHKDKDAGRQQNVRGMDPDKAIGGPAAITFFDNEGGRWQRTNVSCPLCDPGSWQAEDRAEWLAHLGISGMFNNLEGLKAAALNKIPSFEIRYTDECVEEEAGIEAAVRQWREAGGRNLSMHLPSMKSDTDMDEEIKVACAQALSFGCNFATIHVPSFATMGEMSYATFKNKTLDRFARSLESLAAAKVTIGIENMHMRVNEADGENRGYGFTPSECREWIDLLKERMQYSDIGFHFDIGHARNNRSLASRYNLSEWYAELGSIMTGCHLHQVSPGEGKSENHTPFDSLYEPYIPLGAFLMAWQRGQVNHVPMYLEIRSAPPVDTYLTLKSLMA